MHTCVVVDKDTAISATNEVEMDYWDIFDGKIRPRLSEF